MENNPLVLVPRVEMKSEEMMEELVEVWSAREANSLPIDPSRANRSGKARNFAVGCAIFLEWGRSFPTLSSESMVGWLVVEVYQIDSAG